jgi:hypothetical protein
LVRSVKPKACVFMSDKSGPGSQTRATGGLRAGASSVKGTLALKGVALPCVGRRQPLTQAQEREADRLRNSGGCS